MWIRNKFRLTATPGFLLLLAVLYYLDREVGLVPWALLSCVVHEAGHVGIAAILGGKVSHIALTVVGAEMHFEYRRVLSYGEENLLAMAGPTANLILGLCAYWMSAWLLAIISLSIGVFNLLPICPLDGGRILNNLLTCKLAEPWPERICTGIAVAFAGILLGIGVIAMVEYANITLGLTSGWMLLKILRNQNKN